jgi:uncharacterized protein
MPRTERIARASQNIILSLLEPLCPAAVYLFGSSGTEQERADSDLDLAVLLLRPADPLMLFNLSQSVANALCREVDLVDLKSASTVMAKEVIRTGTLLAVYSPAFLQEFEMRALSDYARLNEERQPVLAAFQ